MTISDLERAVHVSDPEPPHVDGLTDAIAESVRYLDSDAAVRSIEADTYWPKWDSPWWHMLLLWELGEAQRIPARVVRAMVDGLEALPLLLDVASRIGQPSAAATRRWTATRHALRVLIDRGQLV